MHIEKVRQTLRGSSAVLVLFEDSAGDGEFQGFASFGEFLQQDVSGKIPERIVPVFFCPYGRQNHKREEIFFIKRRYDFCKNTVSECRFFLPPRSTILCSRNIKGLVFRRDMAKLGCMQNLWIVLLSGGSGEGFGRFQTG